MYNSYSYYCGKVINDYLASGAPEDGGDNSNHISYLAGNIASCFWIITNMFVVKIYLLIWAFEVRCLCNYYIY
jgi:hypothetical protein